MSTPLLSKFCAPPLVATALFLFALHGSAQATAEWITVAPTCAPDSKQTVDFELTSKSGGYARAGRNPPLAYFCPVNNPDDFTTVPTWTQLRLQFRDPNTIPGGVKAKLYQKDRTTGLTKVIASASSTTSAGITTVSGLIKVPMDFSLYGYYVTLELSTNSLPVEAHMVMLTN